MAFTEDLSIFFADFGVDCVADFEDVAQADYEFEGIFEDPYAATQLGTYRVLISEPTILAQEVDELNLLGYGDKVTIDGSLYHVLRRPDSDGTGVVRIPLVAATEGGDDTELTPDESELLM